MTTGTLRLAPLRKAEPVKMTISVAGDLKRMLDLYAEVHAKTWGDAVDAAVLVPHMLAAFMERDRSFKAMCKGGLAGSTTLAGARTR